MKINKGSITHMLLVRHTTWTLALNLANVESYILVQASANTRRRVEATLVPNDTETSLLVV